MTMQGFCEYEDNEQETCSIHERPRPCDTCRDEHADRAQQDHLDERGRR